MEIARHPKAKRDLVELADFIAHENIDAAERFLSAAEAAFLFLVKNRHAGVARTFQNPGLQGLRCWPIREFKNYLIFYRPLDDGIEIVRVLHGARDLPQILGEQT